jgi:hypothetical protein
MKFISICVMLVIFSAVCFSQTVKQKSGTQSSEPTMEETAKWLAEKFDKLKPDSILINTVWENQKESNYKSEHRIIPLNFYLDGKHLTYNGISSTLSSHRITSDKPFTDSYMKEAFEYKFDLTSIDSIRINKDTIYYMKYIISYFYNEFVELKTKNGLLAIKYSYSNDQAKDILHFTDFCFIPLPENKEPDIQNRFIKALNHYIKLCKKKYPHKKEIFQP